MKWRFECVTCHKVYRVNDEDFTVDRPVSLKCDCGTLLSLTKIQPVEHVPEGQDNEHVNQSKP